MIAAPNKPLRIVHLYPEQMNVYGDWGNVLALVRRAEWYGFQPTIVSHHPGRAFPTDVDIVIGGGGQDSGQNKVHKDLLRIGPELHRLAEDQVPMLVVCGLYQLFGNYFETAAGVRMQGIGIFDAETHAQTERLIGNIVIDTDFGEMVGYENHSGLTVLGDQQHALGQVIKGAGNNGLDKTEGAVYRCVFGTYLHGSVLPKNPRFADALLAAAARRYGAFPPFPIVDDHLADAARVVALKLAR